MKNNILSCNQIKIVQLNRDICLRTFRPKHFKNIYTYTYTYILISYNGCSK